MIDLAQLRDYAGAGSSASVAVTERCLKQMADEIEAGRKAQAELERAKREGWGGLS